MSGHPPRAASWLVARRLSHEWREFVLGDLEEEFRQRALASPADARRWYWGQAIRGLGTAPRATQERPPDSGDSLVQTILSDLRYSLRSLLRAPAFAIAVVGVLALGIGANAAIFSIVNAVLLRPLPYEHSERLVRIFHTPPQSAFPGIRRFSVSPANFFDWKRSARLFDGMAIYRFREFVLTGSGDAQSVIAGAVGADFFEVTKAAPSLGRVFLPEEDAPGRGHVVVLSDRFWRSHFGAAPDAVGRTLVMDDEPYTVIGVMPAWFSVKAWGVGARDIWVPIAFSDKERAVRDNHNESVIARLRPGVTLEQAQAELASISQRLEREYPQENTGWGATATPLQELLVGDIRSSLVMLLAAVALVLLIACANVGNLLFARGLGRRKELAIRAALGAGRARVFQQLLTESMVLATVGGAAGLLLARASLAATAGLVTDDLVPRAEEIAIDGRVLLFVLGVSIVTGILAGVMPALRAGGADLNEALKEGGRNDGAVGIRTRRLLIVCEVALSVVLLMGAGVMIRSLIALRGVDLGFNPQNVLTLRVALANTRYDTPDKTFAFFERTLERIRALPGVVQASAIDTLPTQGGSVQPIVHEGQVELLPKDQPTVAVRKILPRYIDTMRIPLLQGRDIEATDADVMVVSRSAAKLLWGNADPLGRRVWLPLESKDRRTMKRVVGIVGDVKQGELSEPPMPTVYEYTRENPLRELAIVIRSGNAPSTVAQPAAAAIRGIDPEQPVQDIKTMDTVLDEMVRSQRFSTFVLGGFAAIALMLASVGIYSVLSYIVRGRSREIGIRTALGARTGDVLRLVIVEGMTPALIGIGLGAIAATGSARLLEKLVFGVSATDPASLFSAATLLAMVALIASVVPALRASRLDPLEVLRAE